jgi:hypothetical protein
MIDVFTTCFKKVDGKLIYTKAEEEERFKKFVKEIPEGKTVNVIMELTDASKSLAQLAKVHKCIRILANEIGYTFEEMKLEIKRRSGLMNGDLNTAKSFADCSLEEINLAIQACIEVGDKVNTNLR